MKRFCGNIALVVLGITVGFMFCEVGLRLLAFKFTGSTFQLDPVLGWSLRPRATAWEVDEGVAWTKINSHGYRDREREIDKPAGVYRIAVLGDSVTEARQVDAERVYTALVERQLNERQCTPVTRTEVLNFGVGGYGTTQQLIQLRHNVWKFDPDMVVLQFYSGNDVFNNHRALNFPSPQLAPYFELRDGELVLDDRFRTATAFHPLYIFIKGAAADLMNRSVALQLLYKVARLHAQSRAPQRNTSAASQSPPDLPAEYPKFLSFLPPSIPAMTEAWQITEAVIKRMSSEVKQKNRKFLLLVVPTQHQIHPDPQTRDAYREEFQIGDLEYADRRIAEYSLRLGIPTIRLSEPLLREASITSTYMAGFANTPPNSGHLNEAGHAVVANALTEMVCAQFGINGQGSGTGLPTR